MEVQISLLTQNEENFDSIKSELSDVFEKFQDLKFHITTELSDSSQIVMIDENLPEIETVCSNIDHRGRAVLLVTSDPERMPEVLKAELVDDVIVRPIRSLEFLSKLRLLQTILMWDEVAKINSSFSDMILRLKEDLKFSERLQQHLWPKKFPKLKGVKLETRYMAGLASGGDYFDVIEDPQKTKTSFILSNSSNYGLSRHFISVFMKMGLKISAMTGLGTSAIAKMIMEEVRVGLSEKDRLSFFFGQLLKKELLFEFVNVGNSTVFLRSKGGEFELISNQSKPFIQNCSPSKLSVESVSFRPEDELLILSNGFVESVGGVNEAQEILKRKKSAHDPLNEFVYHVKSQFEEEDDLPGWDCTGIHLSIAKNVLRVAS